MRASAVSKRRLAAGDGGAGRGRDPAVSEGNRPLPGSEQDRVPRSVPARLRLVAVVSLAGVWLPGALVVSLLAGWPGRVPLVLTVAELAAVAGTVSAAQVLRRERCAAAWVARHQEEQGAVGGRGVGG